MIDENSVRITKYLGEEEVVNIPLYIKDGENCYLVKEIAQDSFNGNGYPVEINIPSSIEVLKWEAFYNAYALKKVTFEGKCPIIEGDTFALAWDAEDFEVYVKEEFYEDYIAVDEYNWQTYLVEVNKIKAY